MTQSTTAPPVRTILTTRPGASRKLLARKASEKLASQPMAVGVEDSFPTAASASAGDVIPANAEAAVSMPAELSAGPQECAHSIVAFTAGTALPAWSDEDERAFRAQLARRKAAGYCNRGRDVGGQVLTIGSIKPNPYTVVAVIVGLVADRGSVRRGELLEALASATFPHPKARPTDAGWCQGYVAGAIRNGFLTVSDGARTDEEA